MLPLRFQPFNECAAVEKGWCRIDDRTQQHRKLCHCKPTVEMKEKNKHEYNCFEMNFTNERKKLFGVFRVFAY